MSSPTTAENEEEEKRDAIAAFQLRSRLKDFPFAVKGGCYSCLIKEKWTYRLDSHGAKKYFLPGTTQKDQGMHAKQVAEYLDQYSMPSIYTVPSSTAPTGHHVRTLRDNVLFRLYHEGKTISMDDNDDNEDDNDDNKEEKDNDSSSKQPKGRKSPPDHDGTGTTKSSVADASSATVFEKGADMYLTRGKTKRNKQDRAPESTTRSTSRRKTTTTTTTNETSLAQQQTNNDVASSLELQPRNLPDPETCVKAVQPSTQKETDLPLAKFYEYKFQLSTGHSLLFYGYGSKRNLLNRFATDLFAECSDPGDVVTIDGYDRTVSMESLLQLLVDQFLDGNEPPIDMHREGSSSSSVSITTESFQQVHSLVERAITIARALATSRRLYNHHDDDDDKNRSCRPIYLMIHNMDGFRHCVAQEALAALVVHSHRHSAGNGNVIRLMASVDHVNASTLLWDVAVWSNLSWIWKEVTTYQPYYEEVKFGMDPPLYQTRTKRARTGGAGFTTMDYSSHSLKNVLTSLAPRHAETLQLLANLQLQEQDNNGRTVDYTTLREQCMHKMIVSSDGHLKAYLQELKDHGIVEMVRDVTTRTERVVIPQSKEKLHEILEFRIKQDM